MDLPKTKLSMLVAYIYISPLQARLIFFSSCPSLLSFFFLLLVKETLIRL
jgi:hypothetical protein